MRQRSRWSVFLRNGGRRATGIEPKEIVENEDMAGEYFRERRVAANSSQYLYEPTENKNKSMNTSVISCKQR